MVCSGRACRSRHRSATRSLARAAGAGAIDRFATGGGDEPGADPVGLFDAIELLDEQGEGPLEHITGQILIQARSKGDPVHQPPGPGRRELPTPPRQRRDRRARADHRSRVLESMYRQRHAPKARSMSVRVRTTLTDPARQESETIAAFLLQRSHSVLHWPSSSWLTRFGRTARWPRSFRSGRRVAAAACRAHGRLRAADLAGVAGRGSRQQAPKATAALRVALIVFVLANTAVPGHRRRRSWRAR